MQSPRLPWEVIERIIDHSRHPKSLRSFSLTCRELLPRSRSLMLAVGVKLKSRDRAVAFVEFLQDNPHLKPFVNAIKVGLDDLPPFPLLHILSDLSRIVFTSAWPRHVPLLRISSTLAGFRQFGSHIQTLHLFRTIFSTDLLFVQLLLAFPNITRLACESVTIRAMGNQAHLALAKGRLSQKLRLQTLVSDLSSLVGKMDCDTNVGDLLLDPDLKLVPSTVKSFEIIGEINPDSFSQLRLSEWSQLQSLKMRLLYIHTSLRANRAIELLENINSTTCKNLTIIFGLEEHLCRQLELEAMMRPQVPHKDAELAQILHKFSQVDIIWCMQPLRATRNSFWARELRNHFPILSQRPDITLALKSETVFPAGHDKDISALVISPNSKWIASASLDSTIIIWNAQDRSMVQQWAFPNYQEVLSLAFSPDSRYLVGGGEDGNAVVWDISGSASASIVVTLKGHCFAITGCAWSPNGAIIATASSDTPMQLSDASTFQVLHVLRADGHTPGYYRPSVHPRVAFSLDGRWLVSAYSRAGHGGYCQCYIWDVSAGALYKVFEHGEESGAVNSIAPVFDSRSTRLVTTRGHCYGGVEVWDVEADRGRFVPPCRGESSAGSLRLNAASFSPNGELLLVASEGGLEVWDTNSAPDVAELKLGGRRHRGRFTLAGNNVRDARFSPCGGYIASAGDHCQVLLWRISKGACILEATLSEHEKPVTHIAFSPDGKTLSSGADDGTVVIRHMHDIIPVEQPNKDS